MNAANPPEKNSTLKNVLIVAFTCAIAGAVGVRFLKDPPPALRDRTFLASMLGWALFSRYWSAAATGNLFPGCCDARDQGGSTC